MNNGHRPNPGFEWAGWQASRYSLERAGWQVATSELPSQWRGFQDSGFAVAMRHPGLKMEALSANVSLGRNLHPKALDDLMVPVLHMAHNIRCLIVPQPQSFKWTTDAAVFRATELSYEEKALSEVVGWQETQSIVIAHESVPQVLDLLLRCQAPKQREIRQRLAMQVLTEAS